MKRRQEQHDLKATQARSVIPYPPGYRGQALTDDTIMFSERLTSCPEEYRGIMMILLKLFAAEVGCGETKTSRDYLDAITSDGLVVWSHADLPTVSLVSIVEWDGCNAFKRVLKIMPTTQLPEFLKQVECLPETKTSDIAGDAGLRQAPLH